LLQQPHLNEGDIQPVRKKNKAITMNDKLEKTFALGKKRYIVRYGVLGWGLSTAALFAVWTCYSKGGVRPFDIILPFIIFPIVGIAWGALMWSFLKKKHDQALAGRTK
jgi:hypothetical protein